jgi:hypothetical protein
MNFHEIFFEEEFAEEGAGATLDAEDCLGCYCAEVDYAVVEAGWEGYSYYFFSFGGGGVGFVVFD